MSLNDAKIRNLKPSAKPFKVSDSHGSPFFKPQLNRLSVAIEAVMNT